GTCCPKTTLSALSLPLQAQSAINLNEIIQRTTPANASGVPMPQAVVADTKAAVCCRLVIVRPRSNQFFRFVLFHVADYIYCSCHLNLIRCNSFTHTDISFSAS